MSGVAITGSHPSSQSISDIHQQPTPFVDDSVLVIGNVWFVGALFWMASEVSLLRAALGVCPNVIDTWYGEIKIKIYK